MKVINGDCLEVLRTLEDDSIDAIVTDPPAGISFMGAKWDGDKGGRDQWVAWMSERMKECLRVLKPGGHILVWALPRTSHWTAWSIENAGFEVRDRVSHFFGTGFPKNHDVSKAVDAHVRTGKSDSRQTGTASRDRDGLHWSEFPKSRKDKKSKEITTQEGKDWEGWGTALKPACEDWWLARKPFKGTVAKNVLKYGTGGLNVDATRIPTDEDGGRWPAHISFDEETIKTLPEGAQRYFYVAKASQREKREGLEGKNPHPTVKAVALMRWLVRLITPRGGVVLDPFCGSGSTGVACVYEGFDFIGIEAEEEYAAIADQRLQHTMHEVMDDLDVDLDAAIMDAAEILQTLK